MITIVFVDDADGVAVLDALAADVAIQGIAIANHVQDDRLAEQDQRCERNDENAEKHRINHRARSYQFVRLAVQRVLGTVANQAAVVAHLVHNRIAGVDAGGTGDALVLEAVPDVDAGGADLHAHRAVDTVTEALSLVIDAALAAAPRFAACLVVGDDQRVLVEHRSLEARIRAHVLADLFAHEAGVAVCRKAVKDRPEPFPTARLEGDEVSGQLANRNEVTHEGEACEQCEADPQELLCRFLRELLDRHRRLVELDAFATIAFDQALDPGERLRPDGLRARVAAP